MKKIILVVSPHADDETLGCGGSILRFLEEGHEVHWLIITNMSVSAGYSKEQVNIRRVEIDKVKNAYNFSGVHELNFLPAKLESIPTGELIKSVSTVVSDIQPEIIFTAYRNDAHSDHAIVFDAVMSASKSFRALFVKKILCYETISETNFSTKPEDPGFRPNVFIDIGPYLDKKIEIMNIYKSEIGEFPFPRSIKALSSLAFLRGSQCNSDSAEAFFLVKEII
ncbi:PIG-L family deacetylase [Gammaproteobacteria bacterium]|nr:PIG-L family deacetylase [Gammaproteobacteria bacterium]